MVVLHYTGMTGAEDAIDRLCDPQAEVSAHHVVTEDGTTLALVEETARAWHAGAGAWGGVCDVNSHSIGIEIVNGGPGSPAPAFPERQMQALETLLAGILERWNIPPERVIAHSDMAPGRKFDPGPLFDWRRLAARGLSVWPVAGRAQGGGGERSAFAAAAATFGYRLPPGGDWDTVLGAFRLRFRPQADGPLGLRDVAVMQALAARWPCDAAIGAASDDSSRAG